MSGTQLPGWPPKVTINSTAAEVTDDNTSFAIEYSWILIVIAAVFVVLKVYRRYKGNKSARNER